MCSSHQHQFSVASRLRLTTQKMAKTFMMTLKESHPSLNGRVAKILTQELVYYILLGTLKGSQKYH